jgi:NAD(P)-dependent dehydrogenase (short-subunit alcohol dehydrogenase family)
MATANGICDGRVVVITGAGRGLGRAHALEFARQGARVVVNDLGAEVDGSGRSSTPADEVVSDIRTAGGDAIANADDVSTWDGAQRLVDTAIATYGRLDTLVNNAGILRDRMLTNMTEDEWDAVMQVHLKGTFAPTRWAATYWREMTKAGTPIDACIVNTSSGSGLYGNPGQSNYGAAKAGIASFTIIVARELERYGVRANAIAPGALTRMTENLGMGRRARERSTDQFDETAPENVSPLVVWLGSRLSTGVTGRVFNVAGGRISVAEGWRRGRGVDKGDRWEPAELTDTIQRLLAEPDSRPAQ